MKFTMGQLLLIFCATSAAYFSDARGVLVVVINLFYTVIDWYILAVQQTVTHNKHLWSSFWYFFYLTFWTASEVLVS